MGNQNDYTDGIALALTAFAIAFVYFVYEPMMDYLFYAWYYIKYPLFTGLYLIPEEVREYLFYYTKLPSLIVEGAGMDLNQSINRIATFFHNNSFDDIFYREFEDRTTIMLTINAKTPWVLLPVTLPFLYNISKKIIDKRRFNKIFSIETLGIQEAAIWPQIQPVIYDYKKFVNAQSLDEGWFAMSPKPMEYFKDNNLIHYYKNEDEDDIDNFGSLRFSIKEKEMHKFFVNEIGKPWTGIEDMSQEKRCVLAIILPKLMRDQKLSTKMNNTLAKAYAGIRLIEKGKITVEDPKHKKMVDGLKKEAFEEVDAVLSMYFPKPVEKSKFKLFGKNKEEKQKEIPEKIKDIIDSHFYEKVIFSAFLQEARLTGVLATCEFIWLKKENRDLWYILSQTGRTACFCETAGAWAHLLTERKVGRKIATPMVQKAIDAADKYLFETHSNYDPRGDFEDDTI
jgi:intracellular multiplication protein IcmP